MNSPPEPLLSGSRETSLGANLLAALFMPRFSSIDAHCAGLDAVAGAGLHVTEISHPLLLSLAAAPLVRRHAENAGLEIRAVHAPPLRRDPTLARQREAAALAAELGAALLIVHVSSLRFASPDPAIRSTARERDLRHLEALLRICLPCGVTLALENGKHPTHPDYLLTLLSALEGIAGPNERAVSDAAITSSPHHLITSSAPTGLVFDSGHAALRGGDPLRAARTMLPRLLHTHLHDNHGARDDHFPPGSGRIDWPALLNVLQAGGFTGALLLELRPRSGMGPDDWQRQLIAGRNTLLGRQDNNHRDTEDTEDR